MSLSADQPYQPIRCDLYDQLLWFATTREPCTISYRDSKGQVLQVLGRILDVYSHEKIEYLELENDWVLPLDALVEVNGQQFQ